MQVKFDRCRQCCQLAAGRGNFADDGDNFAVTHPQTKWQMTNDKWQMANGKWPDVLSPAYIPE